MLVQTKDTPFANFARSEPVSFALAVADFPKEQLGCNLEVGLLALALRRIEEQKRDIVANRYVAFLGLHRIFRIKKWPQVRNLKSHWWRKDYRHRYTYHQWRDQ